MEFLRFARTALTPARGTWLTLAAILLVGALLRTLWLGSLPATLHRDETAIAFNAYSLLKTGRDEHAQPWPISFVSFGDYKLPGMMYSTAGSIAIFGLEPWTVRFPTALAAILTIPAIFWLAREIGWDRRTALLAALLLSLDFWHITQARNIYEPIAGLLWSTLGWASWLAGRRRPLFFIPALGAYMIGALFYNLPFLLMPLLYGWSAVLVLAHTPRRQRRRAAWPWGLATAVLCCVGIAIALLTTGVNNGKSNTTVLAHPEIVEQARLSLHAALVGGVPSPLARVLNHSLVFSAFRIAQGYVSTFDPTYLFATGDHNAWHNLRAIGLGNMNPIILILSGIGLWSVITKRTQLASQLTLLYLLTSPLISSLTIDAPITNRLMDFHSAVILLAAIGAASWWQTLRAQQRPRWQWWTAGLVAGGYIGFFVLFAIRYFTQFNLLLPDAWNPGLPETIAQVTLRRDAYDWIFVTSDIDIGYTYFSFYTPFEPAEFQAQAQWYTSGFLQVGEYGPYRFGSFPRWEQITSQNVAGLFDDQHQRVLVVSRGTPPTENHPDLLWQYQDWRGRPLWYLWELDIPSVLPYLERLAVTPDRLAVIAYLRSCHRDSCDAQLLVPPPSL